MADRFRILLRATAVLLLAAGVGLFMAMRIGTAAPTDNIALAAMLLLVCISSAVTLCALSLIPVPAEKTPAEQAAATRVEQDAAHTRVRLEELAAAIDRLGREMRVMYPVQRPATPTSAAQPTAPAPADRAIIDRLERSLEEVRELAMLTESERERRRSESRDQRRTEAVASLLRLVDQRQFAAADRALAELSRQFPADPDLQGAAAQLHAARQRCQDEAVGSEAAMIEIDVSAGAWQDALARAQQLVTDYPQSPRTVELLARVRRDHAAWRQALAQSLFETLRQQVDQRTWRRALATAQQLLNDFPGHHTAELVSPQLSLIEENAEIEQRQEQEVHIRELIRSRQFGQAIELAEDLLRRFPLSPQAEAINVLLPRIRELAIQEETTPA